ncbi:MAG: NepR family anti-sigma factor [Brevundimonas sp.]
MIDQSHPSRPRSESPTDEEGELEEARLRQQAIGVKLRHMFDQVVNEPVPDEFLDILRRADEKAGGGA